MRNHTFWQNFDEFNIIDRVIIKLLTDKQDLQKFLRAALPRIIMIVTLFTKFILTMHVAYSVTFPQDIAAACVNHQ